MVKALEITPIGNIVEINDIYAYRYFRDMDKDGCSLVVPEIWTHDKYVLSMFVECHSEKYNPTATYLFNHLSSYCKLDEHITGTVYILCENEKGATDITKNDLNYIMERIRTIKYVNNV